MDEYFITKKAVDIILENINDNFIKCLINLSINDRYVSDIKLILGIIEYLKKYMETRRNDILSSYIKYTNKAYYLQLTDNLFRLLHTHLTITIRTSKNLFIDDLINKYSTPSVATLYNNIMDDSYYAGVGSLDGGLPDDTVDRFVRKRIDTFIGVSPEDKNTRDAGTLFKDAYDKLKNTKSLARNAKAAKEPKEPNQSRSFELHPLGDNSGDLL
jgi:hypothetical protein